ncbi:hypothetical protein CFOUR_10890 [Corynebacterium fournieri]|nr:hypothetical protein CFOUR_10890 [Corynebacterium fournieri]
MFNNRRIAALTCAAATVAGACVVPSAGAATVGSPSDGVCSFKVNDAERKYIDSLDRQVGVGTVDERARWASAFETVYPNAPEAVAPFLERFTGSYVTYFNSNLEQNIEREAKNVAAQTGADLDSSRGYFTQVWNSAAVSEHESFDIDMYWSIVDKAVQSGQIEQPVRDGFEEFTLPPDHETLIAQQSEAYPSMPADKVAALVDAYENLPETKEAGRVSRLMVAFEQARQTCKNGGGNVLLPTDGTNPDAQTAPTRTPTHTAPPVQPGNTHEVVTKTVTNGRVTATVTSPSTTMTNLTVSETTRKMDSASDTTQGGSSASTGVIIGVIVAVLLALGAAGAAFALSNQEP